jgi:hypothetical protein
MSIPNLQLPTPKESRSGPWGQRRSNRAERFDFHSSHSIKALWELGVGSWSLTLACALMVVLPLGSVRPHADVIDRILAVVGGEPITQSDALAALRFGLIDVPPDAPDPLRVAIDRLIDRRLQLAEVNRYLPPGPTPALMEERLAAIKKRFDSEAAFEAALAEAGLTLEQLTARVRESLRIDSYRNQRFAVAFQPTDDELIKYYREHETDFTVQGTLRPFAAVRDEVRRRVIAERTDALIRGWTEGLRRRTEVSILYGGPGQTAR